MAYCLGRVGNLWVINSKVMRKIESLYPVIIFILLMSLAGAAAFIYDQFSKFTESGSADHRKMNGMKDMPEYMMNLPGMMGDKTRRYTVDWDYPEQIIAGQPTNMKFRVFNAASGEPIDVFTKNYTKMMHLIVTDSTLTSYQHLHPEYKDGFFEVPVTFPMIRAL